jgi:serine protease
VAGIAALMRSVYPALTPEQFDVLLAAGRLTDDLGPDGRDDFFGHGIINARKAVLEALDLAGTGGSLPAILVPNPSTVNFGSITETLQLRVSNAGSEDTAVAAPRVVPAASWLTVTPAADGTGLFELIVDRSGLADGLYAATLEFDYVSNGSPRTLSVPVRMQITSVDLTADAGYHYVLVVDPASLETVAFTSLPAADGVYPFRLEDVPAGTWEIYAGTDSDNDGFICDAGEACGVFRTIDSPTPVDVSAPRTDLDFVTGFRTRLVSTSGASREDRAKRVSASGGAGIPLPQEARARPEAATP